MAELLQDTGFPHPYSEELGKYIVSNGFVVKSMSKTHDTFIIDCKQATLYVQTYEDMEGAIMRVHWGKDSEIAYFNPVEYFQACTKRTPFVRINEKECEGFRP